MPRPPVLTRPPPSVKAHLLLSRTTALVLHAEEKPDEDEGV